MNNKINLSTKLFKYFSLIFLIATALISCGRKGSLEYVGENKRPNFDNVVDE